MCNSHAIDIGTEPAGELAQRLLDTMNAGAAALMISIGHQTGLFDALVTLPPATSDEIAKTAGLNERYVREWLGAMVCARIIEVDEAGARFALPAAHARFLTREGGADNLAPLTQYIALMGAVEQDVIECFRSGGGVGYEQFDRFHEVMAEDSGQSVVSCLFDLILPLAPGLPDQLTKGIDVLDVGCGRGKALLAMAARYPASRFVGYDLCAEPVAAARAEAETRGLTNVRFEVRDAEHLDDDACFDLITTFDAIHDQSRPDLVLANIQRALRPGGVYLMQDIDAAANVTGNLEHPLGALLYTVSTMHCMTVSLARGGMGLGTMWGRETARAMLAEAGFDAPTEHMLDHDPQNRWYVLTK